ncbi:MAG TPA: hypothetical protein VH475_22895 [Tepidisphaeraceae bacterium]|jgi:prepilin-type processing-associated H-X9-DG protein
MAADRNDGDRWRTTDPDAPQSKTQPMNSSNHRRKGQNVLFNDGHVSWCDTPFSGHARDNIFTRYSPLGVTVAIPVDKYDSVLSPMFPLKNIAARDRKSCAIERALPGRRTPLARKYS